MSHLKYDYESECDLIKIKKLINKYKRLLIL